jgi:lipopolysaccharide/colanic/teichoic acid biosynthesis glycosyltransferase
LILAAAFRTSRTFALTKRLFDLVLAAAALVVVSPLFLLTALAIRMQRNGPIFYRGARVGKDGRRFHILKFRTMVANAEQLGGSCTADDDPRVTRLGRLLRSYKLDEIPQFLNVLGGAMSLVGPRPEVKKYTDMYSAEERRILGLRPGITDWASIWNSDEGGVLKGAADPEKAYEELLRPTKIRLQLRYAAEHSVFIDAKILVYTVMRLCNRNWLPREIAAYGLPRQHVAAHGAGAQGLAAAE